MRIDNLCAGNRAVRRSGVTAALLATMFGLAGCDTDSLVQLPDPDLITLPVVLQPENADAVRNGALFEFARAMAGPAGNNQTPGIVGISGVLSDELWYSSTFGTMREIDRRFIFDTNGAVETVYRNLHRARNLAEEAEDLLADAEADSPDRSRLLSLAGYTYVLFAENWCSNVPFSKAPLGEQLVFRPAIGKTAMLDSAIVRFDEAISLGNTAGAADMVALARLGKARALQDQGDLDGAAALAAQIPEGFVYDVEYNASSAGQNNGVWYNINSEQRTSAASDEGDNGIHFFNRTSSVSEEREPDPVITIDPRVPVDSFATGIGTEIPLYGQFKYPDRGADIPLATWIEAQLIIAEADLNGGATVGNSVTPGNWLAILNDLRADIGLAPLVDPGTPKTRVLMLYEERAFWLWLTAHRVGDLRRLLTIDAYSGMFTVDELYPIGPTIQNESRGDHVAFPVPVEELNNPEYNSEGCMTTEP